MMVREGCSEEEDEAWDRHLTEVKDLIMEGSRENNSSYKGLKVMSVVNLQTGSWSWDEKHLIDKRQEEQ